MTPKEKYIKRRLGEILEIANKTLDEHKEWLEERKTRREERLERLLDRK